MNTCDAIVRSAGMVNLQSLAEMIKLPIQGDNRLDCRTDFIIALEGACKLGNEGFLRNDWRLKTPFIDWTKTDIASRAARLGVPIDRTWSCYKGGEVHCGRCGTCVERQEALHFAGVNDPTEYEDKYYWKNTVETAGGHIKKAK